MSSKQTRSALAPNNTTSSWKVQMGNREIASYAPRVLDGSAGVAPWILAISFRSVQLKSDQSVSQTCIECEQRFELPYLSNKKNLSCIHTQKVKKWYVCVDKRTFWHHWWKNTHSKLVACVTIQSNVSGHILVISTRQLPKFSCLHHTLRARPRWSAHP